MTTTGSNITTAADLDPTNPRPDGQDDGDDGAHETDAVYRTSGTKASMQPTATRSVNTSINVVSEEARNRGGDSAAAPTRNGRQDSQDGLLHILSDDGIARHPTESSIWEWDTPLESIGESTSYYYEPQGELLQESREQRPFNNEFSIPQAVPSPHVHWSPSTPSVGPKGQASFITPISTIGGGRPSVAGTKRKSATDREDTTAGKQPDSKRASRFMSESGEDLMSPEAGRPPAHATRSHSGTSTRPRTATQSSENRPRPALTDVEAVSLQGATSGSRRTLEDPSIPMVLPARKVFPIQIGDKLFRLSGASISSDAPSYFSQFFEEQLRQNEGADSVRTLYIDRDPATFQDIALHLQGYHVEPRDGPHFVKLFADAQFFSLPRLTNQLFSSTIYIRIGNEEFQIPRDLFNSPGDSPNYFSLGFSIFFSTPTEVFPGLSQRTLLRPPSILPPSVPNRSARTFADLLQVLKGYPVEIRSEKHRTELLRDARYFHLKGLEQRLIPHNISYNLARQKQEIMLRLDDLRQSGVSFVADAAGQASASDSPASSTASSATPGPGWIYYQRPYIDSDAYSLIVEVAGEESTFLQLAPGSSSSPARVGRAIFYKQTLARITSLLSVIANKMNLPVTQPLGLMMMERGAGVASLPVSPENTGLSEERVKVRIGADADVTLDGEKWVVGEEDDEDDESGMEIDPSESSRSTKKRKRGDVEEDEGEDWVVKRAQWRIRVQPVSGGAQAGKTGMEVILGAVKIEAYSNEKARNAERGFLI